MSKFKLVSVMVLVAMLVMAVSPVAAATPRPPVIDLKAQRLLECSDIVGKPVMDVWHKVVNNGDSGVGGNTWANDNYSRRITVWLRGDGSYCAMVKYQGSFVTNAGASPNGTGLVDAGIRGSMVGGYIQTFNAVEFAPTRNTRGNLGYYNYRCENDYNVCRGLDWKKEFFTGVSNVAMPYWAWNYSTRNYRYGWWHNGSDINSGDIVTGPSVFPAAAPASAEKSSVGEPGPSR